MPGDGNFRPVTDGCLDVNVLVLVLDLLLVRLSVPETVVSLHICCWLSPPYERTAPCISSFAHPRRNDSWTHSIGPADWPRSTNAPHHFLSSRTGSGVLFANGQRKSPIVQHTRRGPAVTRSVGRYKAPPYWGSFALTGGVDQFPTSNSFRQTQYGLT